jgi:hypothetical protein
MVTVTKAIPMKVESQSVTYPVSVYVPLRDLPSDLVEDA